MMLAVFAALALDPVFGAPTLAGAHVSALAVDASSGAVLYDRNAGDAMVPASAIKLIVGSAALDRLGTGFTFTNAFTTDGNDLYLVGGGDPLLDSADIADAARTLAAVGEAFFPGSLVADPGAASNPRYPDGWQVDDLPNDYAAPASALSFSHNAVTIVAHPGPAVGSPLVVDPLAAPYPAIENDATTGAPGSADTTQLELAWDAPNAVRITGSYPLDARTPDELDASVLDPARFTLASVARDLSANGVTLHGAPALGRAPATARTLWTHRSLYLPALLAKMWQPSDNLLAESLYQAIGGAGAERAWLHAAGIDPATLTIADGSGMSAYDRVSARALVSVLQHDWNGPNRQIVLDALPLAGKRGTLEHAFTGTPLEGAVFAKTGTSNHTRALAGYLTTPHGTVAFALLINDWMDGAPGAADRLRAVQAQFLAALQR